MLKKGDNVWSVKVVVNSKSRAMISKVYGKEGGKLASTSDVITVGKAGRSPQQEALHIAEHAHEAKLADGYTEVRSVHRGSNNELKSINNFKP
jgi:allophanate hydrolase subunit 2